MSLQYLLSSRVHPLQLCTCAPGKRTPHALGIAKSAQRKTCAPAHRDGSADSPRKSPPQLLPVPLAPRPFLLPGGLTAQEGMKGPEEGAQARDSRHQDGTSRLRRQEPWTLQPEAMLLWLTLALLWSPTCWAGALYGHGGGSYFSTTKDNENEITGIRVFIGIAGLIKSIQVKFGSSWSEKYGAPGGTPQEFVLQPGEYITEVDGSYRLFLRHLVIYTSYGRKATFGEKSGRSFSAFPDGSEKVLTGVFGQHKLLGISSIGFEWDYPIVQLTYDQESTTLPQKELGNESDK